MISNYDDYPIHQTTQFVAQPATTDFNFYDRYFCEGFSLNDDVGFVIALGLYPNRRVMDAAFTVVTGGVQHSFHASRLAPLARNETVVGPMRVQVVQPMRVLKVVLDSNDTGIACDLTFTARTAPIEEQHSVLRRHERVIMDTSRFTQFGRWQGYIEVAGRRIQIDPKSVYGTRDRSWGIRPVGERDQGITMSEIPQFFWLWTPVHFDNYCTHFAVAEDADGKRGQVGGFLTPTYAKIEEIPEGGGITVAEMVSADYKVQWEPGKRIARGIDITMAEENGTKHVIAMESVGRLYMLGVGYQHTDWSHGLWKGEFAMAGESWKLDEVDHTDYRFQHMHHVCRARSGSETGIGILEQMSIGPHKPSGFIGFLEVEHG